MTVRAAGEHRAAVGTWAAGAAGAAGAGLAGSWAYLRAGAGPADVARDLAVGWSFAVAGLVAWRLRPANPTGRLMLAEGITWFVGNLQGSGQPVVFALGAWGEALNLAVLAHLLLVYPEGVPGGPAERGVIRTGYGLVAVGGLVRTLAYDPAVEGAGASYLACGRCGPNALLLVHDHRLFAAVDLTYRWAGVALTVAVVLSLVRRWRTSGPARRRVLLPAWVAVALAVAFVGWEILHVLAPDTLAGAGTYLTVPSDLSQVAVPVAFLTGLLRMRLRRASVGGLVIAAGNDPTPQRLQEELRRALGDPTLRLGLRSGSEGRHGPVFTDPAGAVLRIASGAVTTGTAARAAGGAADPLPTTAPATAPTTPVPATAVPHGTGRRGQAVTVVRDGRETPEAVLVHDSALHSDPELMRAVSAALRLCLRDSRLRGENDALATRALESRRRLLRAADEERRRLERDLHDGAQARLVFALMGLARLRARLAGGDAALRSDVAETERTLREALEELRDLAHGIHPAVLARSGLGPAVTALAERCPVPVVVAAGPERYPALVESTAYFVVCEAVGNATRHASPRAVGVTVRPDRGRLVVEVSDDGTGGADPGGGGLRGLADRVGALGGTLEVSSAPGAGTRIRAELPCG
ncbi:sensor histidine kinase [Streptomyces griseoviridis]|uniref:histidine kinase n=1 Tax=Streptomyces griseoviridis TaxID=45398 RepID=A0ABT9LQ67_STRGD|nr:histidine kinase [Streptomyces griseoviridis]MDP9685667.1 signal transduction histidine kinase [Streptomyces griseoviridis]